LDGCRERRRRDAPQTDPGVARLALGGEVELVDLLHIRRIRRDLRKPPPQQLEVHEEPAATIFDPDVAEEAAIAIRLRDVLLEDDLAPLHERPIHSTPFLVSGVSMPMYRTRYVVSPIATAIVSPSMTSTTVPDSVGPVGASPNAPPASDCSDLVCAVGSEVGSAVATEEPSRVSRRVGPASSAAALLHADTTRPTTRR
jgi:hypothetical protein